MRSVNQPCNASSSARPSACICAWMAGEAFQASFTASSPPTLIQGPGKSSATSSSTSDMNPMVCWLGSRIEGKMPQSP